MILHVRLYTDFFHNGNVTLAVKTNLKAENCMKYVNYETYIAVLYPPGTKDPPPNNFALYGDKTV